MARCRENPIARAVRADKLTLAALAATLALYQDAEAAFAPIPVLAMLTLEPGELAPARRTTGGVVPAGGASQHHPG